MHIANIHMYTSIIYAANSSVSFLGQNSINGMMRLYQLSFPYGLFSGSRFHDVKVTVGRSLDNMADCAFYPDRAPDVADRFIISLKCSRPLVGRYVKLQITEGQDNILTLCEVHVNGSGTGWCKYCNPV